MVVQMSADFERLKEFLNSQMRMTHVYQPVMIRTLLASNGAASVTEIAKALLAEDRAQIEYYEQITKRMVGFVLTKNRQITEKHGQKYILKGFDQLSTDEITSLIAICDEKRHDFLETRSDPWSHRRNADGYVSGTIRYEVLKRAGSRCELCGVSTEFRALEIDHIIPRSKGGSDDISNFQVLCTSCNATKNNRDATDFRGVLASYKERKADCLFCEIPKDRVILENELAYAVRDGFPVTPLHSLVIPKRHVETFFDLYQPERNAIFQLVDQLKADIENSDASVSGFNIGMNSGQSAGQTIFHCHVHVIPRRDGDMPDPKGGVRGVIPEMQKYLNIGK
jgi:diadenosine tetraphosphate (Ap4A) HIT family hydrolase